jgi:hypothetical protein
VLAEFATTLLHKLSPAARPEDVASVLDALAPIKLIITDGDTMSGILKGIGDRNRN